MQDDGRLTDAVRPGKPGGHAPAVAGPPARLEISGRFPYHPAMRNHPHRKPSILREALLLLLAACGLALLANAWHPGGLDLFIAPPATGELPADPLQISLEEAARRHADGSAVFVDARSPADYAAGHIRGAVSGPDQEFDRWIEGFIAATEPETVIVAYCEGSRCELSKSIAEKLADLGYANARYLPDGWGRWKAKGLPTETGKAGR